MLNVAVVEVVVRLGLAKELLLVGDPHVCLEQLLVALLGPLLLAVMTADAMLEGLDLHIVIGNQRGQLVALHHQLANRLVTLQELAALLVRVLLELLVLALLLRELCGTLLHIALQLVDLCLERGDL